MASSMIKLMTLKFYPDALPPADSFDGQTILVTGGTSGLGLASAVHFLTLGAKEVIITARNASRGESAMTKILDQARGKAKGSVSIMELDMNSYASCLAFADNVKARHSHSAAEGKGGLDVVVLNAGVTNNAFRRSPEGMEEIVQVNTLSTTLLALLLVPWLKSERQHRSSAAHLVFVSSGLHTSADIQPWPEHVKNDGGVLEHFNKEETWPTGMSSPMYANSKLMLMYAIEELCKMALGPDGRPEVIITSVCPGPVKTDLSRTMEENSLLVRLLVPVFTNLVCQPSEYGSRIYLKGALAKPEQHGQFLTSYITDKLYKSQSMPSVTSPAARKMQVQVWAEIQGALKAKVQALQTVLDTHVT